MSTDLRPRAFRPKRRADRLAGTINVPAATDPIPVHSPRPVPTLKRRNGWDTTWVLFVAMIVFYVLLLSVGPISIVDATPDLDLGSGISLTADGQIKVAHEKPVGPMRIPDESEYNGITMP